MVRGVREIVHQSSVTKDTINPSTRKRASSGQRSINSILRSRQSTDRRCDVSAAPRTRAPYIGTSTGYPFCFDVIGTMYTRPNLLNSCALTTSAGRAPFCSLPRAGLRFTHTISPRAGIYMARRRETISAYMRSLPTDGESSQIRSSREIRIGFMPFRSSFNE